MQRLKRKGRTGRDLGILSKGGMLDLIDNAMKEAYRINDAELDFICEVASDAELDALIVDINNLPVTFAQKRQIVEVLNNLLNKYDNDLVQRTIRQAN
jgi:hypothetical protein